MNQRTLESAVEAAQRFLIRATILRAEYDEGEPVVGTRASGAVKRASMDLTRALAEMRKPG